VIALQFSVFIGDYKDTHLLQVDLSR